MSQPMDQGIIHNLKVHYRRFLLRERIKAIDENNDILVNLLGALHLLRKAWNEVKPETIANCFRHAEFVINAEVEGEHAGEVQHKNDGIDDLLDAWGDLQFLGGINEQTAMTDFTDVDADVVTDRAFTLAEIVAEVSVVEVKEDEESEAMDTEEAEVEEPVISRQQAQSALNLVRRFVEKNTDYPIILSCSDQLDEYLYRVRQKKQKQSQLTEFFPIV